MRLNMGSGANEIEGYESVDKESYFAPKWNVDLEQFPWPWEDNSCEAMLWNHVMEHVGQDPKVFIGIMKEIYRVCAPNAEIRVHVPSPRHDDFLGDPTHVRAILPQTFQLFSRAANLEVQRLKGANTPLALYNNVDFELVSTQYVIDPRFSYLQGDPSWERMLLVNNNICTEIRMVLKAIK